ncbi:hypothetical protein ACS8E2_10225 [Psychrobacter glaciei]|uniref:hypothetical protein n=1 Tax=Psychrobacter glaciei TaxID=619771 RepID=UPI003F483A6D
MLKQSLKDFINKECGGIPAVAKKVSLSERAIYKWASNGSLPRTEYSDETKYSKALSDISGVPVDQIKESFKPRSC